MLITLVLVHALIDIAKYYLEKTGLLKCIKRKNEYLYNLWLFQIDQVLHILLIVLIISFFDHNLVYRYDKMVVLLVLYIAIIMKPANLYLLLLTNKYIPKQSSLGIEGAGKFIGTLERLLYIVSILTSHYEGIALVISVKAFARYKKIADEPEFAEYFTIGTLTSLLISILLYFVVFNLKSSVHF